MKIDFLKISDLVPAEYNPRKLSKKQASEIEASLLEFGFVDPVIVNKNPDRLNVIVGGHQRVKVWGSMGNDTVPVFLVDLSLEKEKELNVRLNKNTGEWDFDVLLSEFDKTDLNDWGFEDSDFPDIDVLPPDETVGGDDVGDPPEIPKTLIGDLYELGEHRLLCGDSTSIDAVDRLMDGVKADMVFTDPPYALFGNSTGATVADDKMIRPFFRDIGKSIFIASKKSAHFYSCLDWKSWAAVMDSYSDAGLTVKNMIVWDKIHPGLGGAYRSQHELIMFGVCANVGISITSSTGVSNDRKISDVNVWQCPREPKLGMHAALKPQDFIKRALNNSSLKNDVVLDLFGGSGSTLIACEDTSRKCRMMEIEPKYCDVIVRRYVKFCKENGREYSVIRNGEPCDDFEV